MKHYVRVEKDLRSCIELVADTFTDVEWKEVSEFIDVGEYGLALITFIDIVEDKAVQVSIQVLQLLKNASEAMQGDDDQIDTVLTRIAQLKTR